METAAAAYTAASPGPAPRVSMFPAGKAAPTARPEFLHTRDAAGAIGIYEACQQYAIMGTVTGKSGQGKSFASSQFARLPGVIRMECNVFWNARDLVREIEDALCLPSSGGTISGHMQAVINFFSVNKGYLLIVDEADKLISKHGKQKMEVLRGIYDKAKVGIALTGLPKLRPLMETYLEETENRATWGYEFRGLSPTETDEFLSPYHIEPDARRALHERAYGRRKSCFRLLERTLGAITLEMEKSGETIIDMEVFNRVTGNMPIR